MRGQMQFLTASNIDFSDNFKIPSYFELPTWSIKPPTIVLDLVHQQLFMEIRDRYRDHIPVYTDGSRDGNFVACGSLFIRYRNFHEIATFSIHIYC